MHNDSDEQANDNEWSGILWTMAALLAVLLILALPAGFVWYRMERQRAQVEMMRIEAEERARKAAEMERLARERERQAKQTAARDQATEKKK